LELSFQQLPQLGQTLRSINDTAEIPFPENDAVAIDQVCDRPGANAILLVIVISLIPQNRMSYRLTRDGIPKRLERFRFSTVDFNDDQAVVGIDLIPPDQVVPYGRAVLSKVKLQPDDISAKFFQR
jgi:hypothetical protein